MEADREGAVWIDWDDVQERGRQKERRWTIEINDYLPTVIESKSGYYFSDTRKGKGC